MKFVGKLKNQDFSKIAPILFLGFLIRFVLLPFPGHEHDMAWWKSWTLFASDKGIYELIKNGNFYNYPPFFAWFLYIVGVVYKIFRNPYEIAEYWSTTNIYYLSLFKGIIIAGDLIISYLVYQIAKARLDQKLALITASLTFLSPIIIFDGSFWGQVDGLGVIFLLLTIFLLDKKKPYLATFVFVLGVLFKLQNIIYTPLVFLYIFKAWDLKTAVTSAFSALAAFILGNFPILFAKDSGLIFANLSKNIDYYPYLSLKAYNFWSIFINGHWDKYPDWGMVFGVVTPKMLGTVLFATSYIVCCLVIVLSKKEDQFERFLWALALAVFSFFMLPTQMHDRYLFPFFAITPVLFSVSKRLQKHKNEFFVAYLLLTILYFVNIYASLAYQYGYLKTFLNFGNERFSVFSISLVLTIAFIVFLTLTLKMLPRLTYIFLFIPILFVAFKNLPYIKGQPIYLSSYLASNWAEDWSKPQKDMNVNSKTPLTWDRLSNNYYFYEKGIGAHANSIITFYPNAKFSTFETDYALDSQALPEARVIFTIEVDGEVVFTSGPMTKTDLPRHLKLSIKDKNKLVLKVGDGGNGINGDHADWLNARLIK